MAGYWLLTTANYLITTTVPPRRRMLPRTRRRRLPARTRRRGTKTLSMRITRSRADGESGIPEFGVRSHRQDAVFRRVAYRGSERGRGGKPRFFLRACSRFSPSERAGGGGGGGAAGRERRDSTSVLVAQGFTPVLAPSGRGGGDGDSSGRLAGSTP